MKRVSYFHAVVAFLLTISLVPASTLATTAIENNGPSPVAAGGMGGAADSAQQAGDSQGAAQMMSMMTAAMLASQCGPTNQAACVMSALAAMQGMMLGMTKAGSYNSGGNFSIVDPGESGTKPLVPTSGAIPNDPALTGAAGRAALVDERTRKELAARGAPISADGKYMTLPNGKQIALNAAAGTDSGMSSAGISQDEISRAKAMIEDMKDQAGSKIKVGDSGIPSGGGGGGSRSPSDVGGYQRVVIPLKNPGSGANLSGLTKNIGNDKMGVAADNIFEMIKRRYKALDSSNAFIKN